MARRVLCGMMAGMRDAQSSFRCAPAGRCGARRITSETVTARCDDIRLPLRAPAGMAGNAFGGAA